MATEYQRVADSDVVVRTADQAWIPNDPMNMDRQRYEQWLKDGGKPSQYAPPPPVVLKTTKGKKK